MIFIQKPEGKVKSFSIMIKKYAHSLVTKENSKRKIKKIDEFIVAQILQFYTIRLNAQYAHTTIKLQKTLSSGIGIQDRLILYCDAEIIMCR